MRRLRPGLIILGISLLVACNGDPPGCPDGGIARGGRCLAAGSSADASHDAGRDAARVDAGDRDGGFDGSIDAGPCGGACSGETPVCDADTMECVECVVEADCDDGVCSEENECVACLADTDCEDSPETPVCDTEATECVGCLERADCTDTAAPACDGETQTCVECTGATDCTEPGASVCDVDANECIPCSTNADCGHLDGLGVCDAGTCVECTGDDASACEPMHPCNPRTNACSAYEEESALTCESCDTDANCVGFPAFRCVELTFEGSSTGGHCLEVLEETCPRPYTTEVVAGSLSGEAEQSYCGIRQDLTTCAAVGAADNGAECTATGMATDCAPQGARCETIGLAEDQCTYKCGDRFECPSGEGCTDGTCGN